MMRSALRMLFLLTIGLTLLLAPPALEITKGGETYAMGGGGGGNGFFTKRFSSGPVAGKYTHDEPEEKQRDREDGPFQPNNPTPAPVPEPATMLLFGAGAVGLAAFKKKFKKK